MSTPSQAPAVNGNTDDAGGGAGRARIPFVAANFALVAGFTVELRDLVHLGRVAVDVLT